MTAWALVLGLTLGACSSESPGAGAPPSSSPGPPPAPTRALVAWSSTACGTVKSLDELRRDAADAGNLAGSAATSYVLGVTTSVRNEAQRLRAMPRTGVKAADAYVAGVTRTLNDLYAKLPDPMRTVPGPEKEMVAKAREIATAVGALKPQGPGLTGAVKGSPKLLVAYNVTPGCSPLPSSVRPAAAAPTRALVLWADTLCTYAELPQKRPPGDSRDVGGMDGGPMGDQFRALELMSFIRDSASRLDKAAEELDAVPATGVAEADRYRTRLLSSIRSVARKLPEYSKSELGRFSLGELEAEADKVARTLDSVEPRGDELPDLVAGQPRLTAAHDLAPACDPSPTPSPTTS